MSFVLGMSQNSQNKEIVLLHIYRAIIDFELQFPVVKTEDKDLLNQKDLFKREVQKSLRKTLLKYQLHKEEELFEKAYSYIKEYY